MRRLVVYKWLVNYQAQDTRRFFSWSFIPLKKNPFDIDLGNEIITSFLKQKRQKRFKGFDLRVFCLHICLDICRSKTKYRKKLYHSYGNPLHDISNEGKWWVDRIQYNVSASYVLSLIFFFYGKHAETRGKYFPLFMFVVAMPQIFNAVPDFISRVLFLKGNPPVLHLVF